MESHLPQNKFFTEKEIKKQAPASFLKICLAQYRAEKQYQKQGFHFRSTSQEQIAHAYNSMDESGFEAINGRQQWSNWRIIPRSLSGNIPDQPILVLDLGCGTGTSTKVLAHYIHPNSKIIGIELSPVFVEIAQKRDFYNANGAKVNTEFVCRSITTPFHSTTSEIEPESVDYVNSSGIIGHHLDQPQFEILAKELKRTLKPKGVVAIDIGPTLTIPQITAIMNKQGFQFLKRIHCVKIHPAGQVLFLKTH